MFHGIADIAAIALDLGTTLVKAGLLDRQGELTNIVVRPAPIINGNGEHYVSDALAYAETAELLLDECIARAGECGSLGICSQRSSFLIWEQATGEPVTPLISWQDNRGAPSCEALQTYESTIRRLSGLPLTPYYFAPKLRVLLLDNPGWLARLEQGELRAGTLDTFLIWRLTSGLHFITDASMAARTQLMDIRQQRWSVQLCKLFNIPIGILPEIKSSSGIGLHLKNGLVLQASVGDQSAALLASVSENRPEAMVNLGTGCFVIRYLQDGKAAPKGYLQSLVYQDCADHAHFAMEGTLNSVAAALAPYPVGDCRTEDLATDDIFCLAEPSGLGAPYFRGDIGVRFSQPVEQLTQRRIAALLVEAVIFRVTRILEEFQREGAIERVFLSGGLSGLTCLQQGIARCVPYEVHFLRQSESSLHGAGLLAVGMNTDSHRNCVRIQSAENPALREKYDGWKLWLDDLLSGPS
ncbi:MAG: FGGY family carbohydrate kinase [Gallionella sp.]